MRRGVVIALALLVVLLAAVFAFKAAGKMPDFEVYWKAGVRARAGGALYRAEDGHYVLKYLPAFAVLAIPAGLLPLQVAKAIWFAISSVFIVVLLALGLELLPERRRPAWLLVTITFVSMAKFLGHELVLGQVNLLLAVLATLAVVLLRAGWEAAAGVLLALAVVVKPYAAIFLPWLLTRGRLRSTVSMGAALVVVLILPIPLYGVHGTAVLLREWWWTVSRSTAPNLLGTDNVSLAAMYAKWFGPGGLASMLTGSTSLVLLLVAAWIVARRRLVRFPEALEAALLLTLMPLLSPQGWDYVFLVSAPAVMLLVNYVDQIPVALRLATALAVGIIAFSIYDLMGRAAYAAFMALSVISVCYLVVIVALAALRARRIA